MKLRRVILTVMLSLAPVAPLFSQDQASGSPGQLQFDVASIRPSKPGETSGFIKPLPGGQGYTARNIPLKLMISLMYRIPMRQIEGGPEWMDTERFDVDAKTDRSYDTDDLHRMYQNLLADRFRLRFHKDVREGNVYALTVDKSGLKLKASESQNMYAIPMNYGNNGEVIGKRVPMSYFCWWLGQQLQQDKRAIIDETGLTSNYDFTLFFAPELPPDVDRDNLSELRDRPSLFEALKEQLGLKLTPQKGPVTYYVIDDVEKPSAN